MMVVHLVTRRGVVVTRPVLLCRERQGLLHVAVRWARRIGVSMMVVVTRRGAVVTRRGVVVNSDEVEH